MFMATHWKSNIKIWQFLFYLWVAFDQGFYFHICDVAGLAIIHNQVLAKYGYKQDMKIKKV
jgi:hypothetical protein